jgi:hypothetical protein
MFWPVEFSTSSEANNFSIGASYLMLTWSGGAVSVAPADGVSCSGKEWAEAAASTPTIEATRALLITAKARLLIPENLG